MKTTTILKRQTVMLAVLATVTTGLHISNTVPPDKYRQARLAMSVPEAVLKDISLPAPSPALCSLVTDPLDSVLLRATLAAIDSELVALPPTDTTNAAMLRETAAWFHLLLGDSINAHQDTK